MPIRNIIFDWSGVISDDLTAVLKTYNYIFELYGVQQISLDEFRDNFVLPYTIFNSRYLPSVPMKTLMVQFREIYPRAAGEIKPIPGAVDTIHALWMKGIRMVILSSHSFVSWEIIHYFGCRPYFLGVYQDVVDKESVIHELLREFYFDQHDTAYVGDMTHDIEVGHAAGLTTVAVLSGYQSRVILAEAHPHYIIDDIRSLEKVLAFT